MTLGKGHERRKHTRVGFATQIQIVIDADGEHIDVEGNSKDLSIKGIFVSTETRLPAGTKCSVRIYLLQKTVELLMNATVVRETDNGMGIEFDSMDVDSYSHLKNIVSYNSVEDSF